MLNLQYSPVSSGVLPILRDSVLLGSDIWFVLGETKCRAETLAPKRPIQGEREDARSKISPC